MVVRPNGVFNCVRHARIESLGSRPRSLNRTPSRRNIFFEPPVVSSTLPVCTGHLGAFRNCEHHGARYGGRPNFVLDAGHRPWRLIHNPHMVGHSGTSARGSQCVRGPIVQGGWFLTGIWLVRVAGCRDMIGTPSWEKSAPVRQSASVCVLVRC
jgi:hypothetical protein